MAHVKDLMVSHYWRERGGEGEEEREKGEEEGKNSGSEGEC